MPALRIRTAAELLGVSDDTVRRWIDTDVLTAHKDESGRLVVDGAQVAEVAVAAARPPRARLGSASSARNRLPGLVTRVVVDGVMAQVEMQCGPFVIVSLMSSESVRTLGLEPGSVVAAAMKATTVVVESIDVE
ncbi:TOBE domain-containing protein [Nocardia stercoris]|uniref:Helix-turn-helix domain-containing protein n=1 Tax=Nocardia stercoris TaxID=2483361 RepID=A0A3M2L8Y5_9NOCA|nr:TOBE domain-containing protein [Nocardia stercoris]RMI34081.1 helix-turn-helix domain-containing protein [Nocardia stercoris]